jgi:hypothetical protein
VFARTLERRFWRRYGDADRRGDLERHIGPSAREGRRVSGILVGLVLFFAALWVVELVLSWHRERALRGVIACERMAGYAHGYRDGVRGELPAYRPGPQPVAGTPGRVVQFRSSTGTR